MYPYLLPYFLIALQSVGVYGFILIMIRLFGKKELAQLSVIDLVFMLLISNAVQNAMVTAMRDKDNTVDFYAGLVSAFTLFVVNYGLKWLLYRNKTISRLVQGQPVLLIYKGSVRDKNLHDMQISIDELHAAVREHGVESIEKVSLAVLEIDGNISVLSNDIAPMQTFKKRKTRSHTFGNI